MSVELQMHLSCSRRAFLKTAGKFSLGSIALQSLLANDSGNLGAPKANAKAKRVIYLHMAGGPPQHDLFDYKPELVKRNGQLCPDEFVKGRNFAFTKDRPVLLGTHLKFARHGKSGMWMSELLKHLPNVADELCMVHSMQSDQINHGPAELLLFTGSPREGRPSLGSWVSYGLGSENQNMPAFVVLTSQGSGGTLGVWGNAFLPSIHQGVTCNSKGDPILFLKNPAGITDSMRNKELLALDKLNNLQFQELGHPETVARIAQYEMAFRMQSKCPDLMDISKEPESVHAAYGIGKSGSNGFARNCLLARRLVESGVRFVQVHDNGWDLHGTGATDDIHSGLANKVQHTDQPIAALIRDLKERGLLDDTLLVWGGEFGRTPFREGRTSGSSLIGRDHHPYAYTMFLVGAGVRPGFTFGETDELGFDSIGKKVHIHDLHATILHLLGLDHTKLVSRFQGRDFRLTDVSGEVVREILT